jgi:hypothetical protein
MTLALRWRHVMHACVLNPKGVFTMTYEAMNADYVALDASVSLVPVAVVAKGRVKKAKVAKAPKAKAVKVAKPKAEKKAKAPKAVSELSEKAAAMLAELRRVADAEGNLRVTNIALAGVTGRSIGALLSVLARRKLYMKGVKGHGVVKMPA